MAKGTSILAAAVALALAAGAVDASGYKDTVVAPPGWSDGLERIVVFASAQNTVVNASEIESQTEARLSANKKLPFRVVPGALKAQKLMLLGIDGYSDEKRSEILSALDAQAVLLIEVPHASQSQFGMQAAETRVTLKVLDAEGRILMKGESSGRAWNTASSPENIARHAALRVLGKATGLNLD